MREDDTQNPNSGVLSEVPYARSLDAGLQFMKLLTALDAPVRTEVTSDSNGNINVIVVGSGTPSPTLVWTTSSQQEALNLTTTCLTLYGDSFARVTDSRCYALRAIIAKLQTSATNE